MTIREPEKVVVPPAHKQHPVQTPPSGAQVELQTLGCPGSSPRPPPSERRKNNFYWPHLPGDWETSGAELGPGHVSPGGPPAGAETADSGKAGLRRPVCPGRQPTAPPQQPEAWASSQAERPPRTLGGGELVVM